MLYENRVELHVYAEAPPNKLLSLSDTEKKTVVHDEIFAFDRTVSRLLEMQSEEYGNDCKALWLKHTTASMALLVQQYAQANSVSEESVNSVSLLRNYNAPQFLLEKASDAVVDKVWSKHNNSRREDGQKDATCSCSVAEIPHLLAAIVEAKTGEM